MNTVGKRIGYSKSLLLRVLLFFLAVSLPALSVGDILPFVSPQHESTSAVGSQGSVNSNQSSNQTPNTPYSNEQVLMERISASPQSREQNPSKRENLRASRTSDRGGAVVFTREELEKKRREFKDLPTNERRERIRAWRERHAEFRARLDAQLANLRQKEADGTITEEELHRLDRIEILLRRFEQSRRRHLELRQLQLPKTSEE